MTQRKKLPIGIQTFARIRSENYYYVDKTSLALDLINKGSHYFLSRPRRFGKSLFLDTLKELFEGNEPLFRGLGIHEQWDWSVKYPVLRFSFGSGKFTDIEGLANALDAQLTFLERQFDLNPTFDHVSGRFAELILHVHKKIGLPVVILVDEYDKPILDALDQPELAKNNRDFLRGFYGTIKDYDAYIKFSFLTGVSKFSKVSLFSGLNNLYDLTLDSRYSTICGYTDDDIDTTFNSELDNLDRDLIKQWYNGYNWLGKGVYNPFDILQLFKQRQFKNYWFETGTPTFLINLLIKRQVSTLALDQMFTSSSIISSFEIEDIATEALLFQTGYLTIIKYERLGSQDFFTLGYPNLEVRQSLNENILLALVKDKSKQAVNSAQLYRLLLVNDFEGLRQLFHSFYASIPYNWYSSNDIQNYEGYYASVFYSYFAALGLDVIIEDASNHGRLDMAVKFNHQVYLFEFKVVDEQPTGVALQQLHDKHYADKYRALNQPIYLIGVEFSKQNRNIVGFAVETT
ncbi:MAG: ATP-binding protein [Thiofilum sp.]|uniref:ATP-binding protein n=1 Tax=Thiofilum sp. TaxID=2212733 RepID=UPI0025F596E0|nr:ATP-binding protein [Thiofilum sp.]MBK8454190.1 ATP-binding protein [Thiofilum sp.]